MEVKAWIKVEVDANLCDDTASFYKKGPPIKYVTLEGEGVREGVTVCDRGRGVTI